MFFSFLRSRKNKQRGVVSLDFRQDGIACVYSELDSSDNVLIKACDFIPCIENKRLAVLKKYVKLHRLHRLPTVCTLSPSDYHLLLLDSPHVPADELKSATHFLIKDLIDFPLKDAAIDVFDVPSLSKPKIYVVAAAMATLKQLTRLTQNAGLAISYIGILELALGNLLLRFTQSSDSVALLFEDHQVMYLLVISDHKVCLSRKLIELKTPMTAQMIKKVMSEIGLEIQKSFDYYQSQIASTLPIKLFVAPMETLTISESAYNQLSSELSLPVVSVNLNESLQLSDSLNLDALNQARCLAALSGSLDIPSVIKAAEEALS